MKGLVILLFFLMATLLAGFIAACFVRDKYIKSLEESLNESMKMNKECLEFLQEMLADIGGEEY